MQSKQFYPFVLPVGGLKTTLLHIRVTLFDSLGLKDVVEANINLISVFGSYFNFLVLRC